MPRATSSKPVGAAASVVSLKVTLRGSKPPIWRRLLVSDAMTLAGLHTAIQAAMGWTDSHLHAFSVGDRQYGDPRQLEDAADERRVRLDRLIASGIGRFDYTYDFGDGWDHLVVVEKTAPQAEGPPLPACVAGRRACPPEDCGGLWGYADLLDILADPAHPEHAERVEWLGGPLDPEVFDIERANAALREAFTPSKGRRGVWMKA